MRYAMAWMLSGLLVSAPMTLPQAATFVVNSGADAVDVAPGDANCETSVASECTLRAAVMETNALAGSDAIELPAGTYQLTISGNFEDASASGDLDITDDVILEGEAARTTIIDGGELDRVIEVHVGAGVSISGVTIQNGNAGVPGGFGGGINHSGQMLELSRCTFRDNTASIGGGLSLLGDASIDSCTLHDNWAEVGGGLVVGDGDVTLVNSTISGNFGEDNGGGLANIVGYVDLTNVTISNNTTNLTGESGILWGGGGVWTISPFTWRNSIVAGNFDGGSAGECQFGIELISEGGNLDGDGSCFFFGAQPSDQPNTDPLLGPLADSGGPTLTHLPSQASPVHAASGAPCPATDQRGIPRTEPCDIGAVEFGCF